MRREIAQLFEFDKGAFLLSWHYLVYLLDRSPAQNLIESMLWIIFWVVEVHQNAFVVDGMNESHTSGDLEICKRCPKSLVFEVENWNF